ncbi:unnamed protein product [Sphagnum balticum]
MADYNSSLPVRTQNNGDVVINIADGTVTSQLLAIDSSGRITVLNQDGAGNALTSQVNGAQRALDVGINVAGVQIDPRSIRALTSSDVVSAVQSGTWNVGLSAGSNLIGSVNQGTSPWIVKDQADGSASGGAAGSFSNLAGAIYNSSLPTLTNGQQVSLQVDSSGRLLVDIGSEVGTLSTSDAADGAVANGAAGSKSILGGLIYLSSAPTLTSGNQNSLLGDVSGNLLVNLKTALPAGSNTIGAVTQASGPWTSNITQIGGSALAFGQAVMASSIPVVLSSNQSAIPVSQSGTWNVGLSAGSNLIGSVNQGTSPWIVSNNSLGSSSGGTAGSQSSLAGGVYNTALPSLTNGQQASIQLDSSGRLIISPLTTSSVVKVDLQDGSGNSLSSTSGALNVALQNSIPAGTNAIGSVLANLQVSSAAVSVSNPVPVTITSSTPGTPVQDYHTSASLAAGSSVTFTYTVAASHTFSLDRVWASASGKIKAVVQNNGSTIMVGFNSTANPNIDMTIIQPPTIAAGATVTVIITNDDKAAFDVYATIEGNQN